MKKVLSFILVLSMVLGSFGFAFAAPATSDIAGHDNEAAIQRLNKLGLVTGDDRGFAPDDNITRAEFAVVLVRALGLERSANLAKGDTQFTDVTIARGYEWASGAINIATQMGYIQGYGDGKFGPADNIRYEDAITLIVRALGYEPAAQDRGGYPVGHLVVAERMLDITDKADGVAGIAATRGTVFQLLDNALTEDMMVQVGFGSDRRYEVEEGKTLLGELGFTRHANKRMTAYNADRNEITLVDAGVVEVEEGFDFEANLGLRLTVFVNDDDEVVVYEVKDTPLFDAIKVDGDELTLVDADEEYDIDDKVIIRVNGKSASKLVDADYAKVVLNRDGDVVFVDAYNWVDYLVVEEVDGNIVYGYSETLNVKDYTIVQDGKTINVEDLEERDILFFNKTAKYAEVFNNSVTGEIDRIYDDAFEVNGTDYDYFNEELEINVKYINDNDKIANFDEEVAEQMQEEGEVTVFVDRRGNAVFVSGDLGAVATSSFFGMVMNDDVTTPFPIRNTDYYALDVLNADGDVVSYDVKMNDADDLMAEDQEWTDLYQLAIVKITVDVDGEIDTIEIKDAEEVSGETVLTDKVEAGDRFIGAFRVQSSAVVFLAEDYYEAVAAGEGEEDIDDITVTTYGELDFDITEYEIFVNDTSKQVEAIVVRASDREPDYETYDAIATAGSVKLSGENTWRVRLIVEDWNEATYFTVKDRLDSLSLARTNFVSIDLTDDNEIRRADKITTGNARFVAGEVDEVDVRNGRIKVDGTTYRLDTDAQLFNDRVREIALRDINEGDKVEMLRSAAGSIYVKYVVVVDEFEAEPENQVTTTTWKELEGGENQITFELEVKQGDTVQVRLLDGSSVVRFANYTTSGAKELNHSVDANTIKIFEARLFVNGTEVASELVEISGEVTGE